MITLHRKHIFSETPITIYNSLGKLVKHQIVQNLKHEINVSGWAPGMYFVNILGENQVEKIIVK